MHSFIIFNKYENPPYLKWIKLKYRHILRFIEMLIPQKFLTNEYDKGKTYRGKVVKEYIYAANVWSG